MQCWWELGIFCFYSLVVIYILLEVISLFIVEKKEILFLLRINYFEVENLQG